MSAAKGRTTAKDGSDLVQVSTFPLLRAYKDSLFTKVASELKTRMTEVAEQTGGSVGAHRVVTVDGGRAHSYDVDAGGRSTSYTFVLRGLREYQLLCTADDAVCTRLLTSFDARG